jgi:hypothetical protein
MIIMIINIKGTSQLPHLQVPVAGGVVRHADSCDVFSNLLVYFSISSYNIWCYSYNIRGFLQYMKLLTTYDAYNMLTIRLQYAYNMRPTIYDAEHALEC